jgi:hypothetical protein
MDTKIIYGAGAAALIASAAIAWSCIGSDEPTDLAAEDTTTEFRGFNEPLSGAIFTTLEDGSAVNANIYDAREDVYLDGGPGQHAPAHAAGLPEGDYYFQVTDPSGKDLLSEDHISCRRVHVNEAGVIDTVYDDGRNYTWHAGAWLEAPCKHEQGEDQDHSADGAITVQLMPYAKTTNKGGVYKVWMTPTSEYTGNATFVPQGPQDEVNGELYEPGNYHGFVPAHSKTDNFKVKRGGKPQILVVRKFHDANANATMDEGEEEVEGWTIFINDPLGAPNTYFTRVERYVSEGTWAVQEDMPAGSEITASYLDGRQLSAYPNANPLVLVTVEGTNDERHEVLYGDVGIGEIDICKVYDADGDGVADPDEQKVAGWAFQLDGTDVRGQVVGPIVQTTGPDGCTSFVDLLPGTYTVTEKTAGGDWIATGETSATFNIVSTLTGATITGSHESASFTNYCKGTAAFGTKGYWHNKNGLREMSDESIAYANGLSPYAQPSSYFGAGDEPFDGLFADGTEVEAAKGPEGDLLAAAGTSRAEVSHFLIDANANGDPREQLAQQLLAFIFNTRHRLDGPGAGIQLPDGSFASAQSLIDRAIAAWEGDDAREQTEVKDILDAFNNSSEVVFIYAEPCALP